MTQVRSCCFFYSYRDLDYVFLQLTACRPALVSATKCQQAERWNEMGTLLTANQRAEEEWQRDICQL